MANKEDECKGTFLAEPVQVDCHSGRGSLAGHVCLYRPEPGGGGGFGGSGNEPAHVGAAASAAREGGRQAGRFEGGWRVQRRGQPSGGARRAGFLAVPGGRPLPPGGEAEGMLEGFSLGNLAAGLAQVRLRLTPGKPGSSGTAFPSGRSRSVLRGLSSLSRVTVPVSRKANPASNQFLPTRAVRLSPSRAVCGSASVLLPCPLLRAARGATPHQRRIAICRSQRLV